MHVHYELTEGPGYFTGARLSPHELAHVRRLVFDQYLHRLRAVVPSLVGQAQTIGIENYHLLPLLCDHATTWSKAARQLPPQSASLFYGLNFVQRLRQDLGMVTLFPPDLTWRLVRPNAPDDVGPIHADKWFWDAGNGAGQMPEGCDRFKIWLPLYTEPGANGLLIKPESHRRDDWKHHFETRDGFRKPVLDERVEDLRMELLPLQPGQMVMFHDKLLHGGCVNRGSTCRVSVELTVFFQVAEAERRMKEYLWAAPEVAAPEEAVQRG